MSSTIFLGDSCDSCGATAREHLQNPFGIRLAVFDPKSGKTDWINCYQFVDKNGFPVPRESLYRRMTRNDN